MIKKIIVLFVLLFISCKNEKEQLNTIQKNNCKTSKIQKGEVFEKLNYTVKQIKYLCDSINDNTFTEKYECQTKIWKYFSDKNFSFYAYDDNTRLVYYKNEKIWIAIKANGYAGFDVLDHKNRFVGLYILDQNLTPTCYIHSSSISVFIDYPKNKWLKNFEIELSKDSNFNLNNTSFEVILELYSQIKQKKYTIKNVLTAKNN